MIILAEKNKDYTAKKFFKGIVEIAQAENKTINQIVYEISQHNPNLIEKKLLLNLIKYYPYYPPNDKDILIEKNINNIKSFRDSNTNADDEEISEKIKPMSNKPAKNRTKAGKSKIG